LRLLKRILLGSAALVIALALAVAVAGWLGLRLELRALNAPLEAALESVLGRKVTFAGAINLVPSLEPTLEVNDVQVANVPGGESPRFARFGRLRLQLSIPALFSGRLHVIGMYAEEVSLHLENDRTGRPNWRFHAADTAPAPGEAPERGAPRFRLSALDEIRFRQIQVRYHDAEVNRTLDFRLETLDGRIPADRPLEFRFEGRVQESPFHFTLKGNSLRALLETTAPWPLELEGVLAGTRIQARGRLLRSEAPEIQASLQIRKLNLGRLLERLGLVKGMDAGFERLTAETRLRGESLSQLVSRSSLTLRMEAGSWRLQDPNTGTPLVLEVDSGALRMEPERPVSLELEAHAGGNAARIRVRGAPPADYLRSDKPLPLRLEADAGGARILLTATARRPLTLEQIPFHLSLSGENLADLSPLLQRELPPLGPYRLEGTFALVPAGYRLGELELRLGRSRLQGTMELDTRSRPPRLEVELHSPLVQLDDFRLAGWSPLPESGEASTDKGPDPKPSRARVQALLGPGSLAAQDFRLHLKVDQVKSGSDRLGRGEVQVVLDGGRLAVEPLELALPGGTARLSFLYHPRPDAIELALKSRVEQFDYGVLARRIDPASPVGGRLSLRVDLHAKGKGPRALLENGRGRFDFGIWPKQLEADLFDLWAVNVLSSLLARVDEGESSKVNCVVARMQLEDGIMHDRVILADTSRMRVEASATIDFHRRTLDIRAKPRAKKAEFFSLATPVRLTGTFDRFRIRLNPVELGGSLFSFVTSPLHVPLQRLFGGEEPADGKAACRAAWEYEEREEAGKRPDSPPAAR